MKLLALAATGLALAGGVAAASSEADPVTLSLRQYTNASKVLVHVWFGQVASSAADEDVEVLGRTCLTKDYRLFTATKTVAGGGYEAESAQQNPPYQIVQVDSGTTFRARWRDQLSNTISYRAPLPIFALEFARNTWTVKVNPSPHNMKLAGKTVLLQRRRQGKWVTYRRARLVHKPLLDYGGAYNHQAKFKVTAKGLELRAYLPAASAAPCYLAGASKQWRS